MERRDEMRREMRLAKDKDKEKRRRQRELIWDGRMAVYLSIFFRMDRTL